MRSFWGGPFHEYALTYNVASASVTTTLVFLRDGRTPTPRVIDIMPLRHDGFVAVCDEKPEFVI
jgi:hypothetical protein